MYSENLVLRFCCYVIYHIPYDPCLPSPVSKSVQLVCVCVCAPIKFASLCCTQVQSTLHTHAKRFVRRFAQNFYVDVNNKQHSSRTLHSSSKDYCDVVEYLTHSRVCVCNVLLAALSISGCRMCAFLEQLFGHSPRVRCCQVLTGLY